jgi:hypothetical protein
MIDDRVGGFSNSSFDGGLELFELSSPSWRSSSAIRAFKAAFSAVSAWTSATSSSRAGSMGDSQLIQALNLNVIPMSNGI